MMLSEIVASLFDSILLCWIRPSYSAAAAGSFLESVNTYNNSSLEHLSKAHFDGICSHTWGTAISICSSSVCSSHGRFNLFGV